MRAHFDGDAVRFDAIYDEEKSAIARLIDHRWRGVVRDRLSFALKNLAPLEGKHLLDVGTGSGRFCHEYALNGAALSVGIDFASSMIGIARRHAERLGIDDRCRFVVGSFPENLPTGKVFDAATAMGFFDYVEDPVGMVAAIRQRTKGRVLMSFPKSREWRAPVRKLRFALMRCPLHLYSRREVERIMGEAGIAHPRLHDLGRDFVVSADV